MPIKHAGFKALRQTHKNTARNAKVKSQVDFLLRQSRKMLETAKPKEALAQVKKTIIALDKAAQHKIFKKNTASRLKSRLMLALHKATAKK